MPKSYVIANEESQRVQIVAGVSIPPQTVEILKNFRYQRVDVAFAANDFIQVINILGSRHATSAIQFKQSFDPKLPPHSVELSDLDRAIQIWSSCLPHLKIHSDKAPDILVERIGQNEILFDPTHLSDGERAVFYLVAKAMIAERDGIIIVDEPEMYVHRAIRNKLWDLIEGYREDCVFVYLTHDVDFAATRVFKEKFVVKAFKPGGTNVLTDGTWDFIDFSPDGNLPEDVQLAILGSRQPVLLIEGDGNSLDLEIARAFYKDFYIQPKGSCGDVIRSVVALNANTQFHHKSLRGLIDRDSRSQEESDALAMKRIYVHKVREIENVIVSERVLLQVSKNMGREHDFGENLAKSMSTLQAKLKPRIPDKSFALLRDQIRDRLDASIAGAKILSGIEEAIRFDPKSLMDEMTARLEAVLQTGNLDNILSIFSVRKDGFGDLIAKNFGFKDWGSYQTTVLGWLKSPQSETGKALRAAMSSYLPSVPID